jgi:FixJ family two-component response regulator
MTAPIIHIVDDDESTRTAVARLVTATGFKVRTYANADELVAAFTGRDPGCLILDVNMPGTTGPDLQLWVLQQDDPLSIIFLTGHATTSDSVRALQRGAVDFLTKPIDAGMLLDAIARAVARDTADRAARAERRQVGER